MAGGVPGPATAALARGEEADLRQVVRIPAVPEVRMEADPAVAVVAGGTSTFTPTV